MGTPRQHRQVHRGPRHRCPARPALHTVWAPQAERDALPSASRRIARPSQRPRWTANASRRSCSRSRRPSEGGTSASAMLSTDPSGGGGALLRRRPLRTVHASFPAHGSSHPAARVQDRAEHHVVNRHVPDAGSRSAMPGRRGWHHCEPSCGARSVPSRLGRVRAVPQILRLACCRRRSNPADLGGGSTAP